MATLSSLLNSIAPANVGNVPTRLKVYHTSVGSPANGGCCCLWTVPAGISSITFELYGGGASGNDGCCCVFESFQGTAGSWTRHRIDTQPGCQYRICAGSSTSCAYQVSNNGCTGCASYVYDVTAGTNIACACGGEAGTSQHGHSGPYNAYTCCFGRIQSGSSASANSSHGTGEISIGGMGGTGLRNTYCHTQYYIWNSGGFRQLGRRNEGLCACWHQEGRYVMCTSNDPFTGQSFPGGPGVSAIACGGVHFNGQPGSGGQVIVKYS